MSRLPRASFALPLSLLPATATIIGAVVLAQVYQPPLSNESDEEITAPKP